MPQKWSEEIVVTQISKLHRRGQRLNSNHVQAHQRALYHAACSYFGGWRQAIEVAGLTYDDIRVPHHVRYKPKVWGKKRIVAVIRRRNRLKQPLNSNHIQTNERRLYGAAGKYFGGWPQAVIAAGLHYEKLRKVKLRTWSREAIVQEIKRRVDVGLSISGADVCHQDHGLYQAARRHFGKNGWVKARRHAGFVQRDPRKWGRENVMLEIQRRHLNGLPLNVASVQKDYGALLHAAQLYFGSWAKAIRYAGLDYSSIRKAHPNGWWTEKRILQTIRQLDRRGVRLSSKAIQLSGGGLFAAAVSKFGSWGRAVESAGISYRLHCRIWSTKAWLRRMEQGEYQTMLIKAKTHGNKRRRK